MAEPLGKPKHSLVDHMMGVNGVHSHDEGDFDHDHDHDDVGEYDLEQDALWLADHITLVSVGIDIGSSGTQVIFSRVYMRRLAEDLTSRYFVVKRETLHQSPVTLTPYQSEERIDERAVGDIIDRAYREAGIHPDNIDTGAVILTGEALRRDNAKAIADVLAEMGGEFVCATAGHHMESLLAAYGSGAARASHDLKRPVLNVDIGGGTTKLALVENGRVVHTGAIHIGGRLAVVEDGRLTRLDPAGRQLARNAGVEWSLGGSATEDELTRVTEWMADALVRTLTEWPTPSPVDALWLTDPLEPVEGIAGVMFSGGVGEYVYGRESRDFGDLGRRLGLAIRKRLEAKKLPYPLLPAGECIRATAIGASEYSVQLSGNTVYVSNPGELLPRKNLQVLQPDIELAGSIDATRVTQAIRRHFQAFDRVEGEAEVALAFRWQGPPAYERLEALARGIVEALPMTLMNAKPVFLVLDGDIAHSLGALLKEDWGIASEVLVIDGVSLWDFDYVDLGRVRMPSYTVPVTIKSLVFTEDPRGPRMRGQGQSHDHGHGHDHAHGEGHHHHHHRHAEPGRAP
ncbi:MAG TPA: ethanolamine ammonia-lyase reactivating factor EutA [Usitatibacter sp.]|jgi:ethanolamine utilization protein EutA|nr:ethanolamine ammonia-lyase reactivating factor EutA [Usitatibacter sp.]